VAEPGEGSTIAAVPARPSDADRDRVIAVLRDGVAEGRLSQDTFVSRMELALSCQARPVLEGLIADVRPERQGLSRLVHSTVARLTAYRIRLRRPQPSRPARMPELRLPALGPVPLRIGRAPANGLRLNDITVSRSHAVLSHEDNGWMLHDLGSMNGTYVNGHRVAGRTVVRAGDLIAFGRITFRLAA
jgi:hypothetical protein